MGEAWTANKKSKSVRHPEQECSGTVLITRNGNKCKFNEVGAGVSGVANGILPGSAF